MDYYKEVDFYNYCKKCLFKDKSEKDDPCDECLAYPTQLGSKKPINFKERKEDV